VQTKHLNYLSKQLKSAWELRFFFTVRDIFLCPFSQQLATHDLSMNRTTEQTFI